MKKIKKMLLFILMFGVILTSSVAPTYATTKEYENLTEHQEHYVSDLFNYSSEVTQPDSISGILISIYVAGKLSFYITVLPAMITWAAAPKSPIPLSHVTMVLKNKVKNVIDAIGASKIKRMDANIDTQKVVTIYNHMNCVFVPNGNKYIELCVSR